MTKAPSAPLVLALSLLCLSACAPKVNDPADVQAIKDTGPAYDKFANAGDAASLASEFYAADGIRMDPDKPASAGTAAIRATLEKSYAQTTENIRNVIDDVRVAGGIAVAKGTYEGTATPKPGGTAVPVKGKFVTLYERQGSGPWKAVWDIYNSDLPAPGATADGADEQAIRQIEQDWAAAMVKGDMAVLESNLATEWTLNEDGQVTSRAQALGAFKSGAYKVESATLRDLRVFVLGDAAIATMVAETNGTFMGKPVPPLSRSTDFFVKRDGRWQAVSTQNTAIK
jgi:ketosteroid isomerase-like protein